MADISDQSNDISIHDNETHKAVTTTEKVAVSKVSLDVNITNDELTVDGGASIRYSEMTKNQSVGTSFVNVYNTTTVGKVFSIYMLFNDKDIYINVIIDSVYIINGINLNDLATNYNLDVGSWSQLPRTIYTLNSGKGVAIEFPAPAIFNTSFIVQARHGSATKELTRGIVIRAVSS